MSTNDPTYVFFPGRPHETLTQYALRALAAIVETPTLTSSLETDVLEAIDHAYPHAVAGLGTSATDVLVLARLTDARHQVLGVLRARVRLDATPETVTSQATHTPNVPGGARVPVVPIVPSLSPAGAIVRPDVAF